MGTHWRNTAAAKPWNISHIGASGNTGSGVPSTAVSEDATLRPRRTFALLHWLSHVVPMDWQMDLSPDHRVSLTTEMPVELPITAAALVTRITCFALALAPYLDMLDEAGVTTNVA